MHRLDSISSLTPRLRIDPNWRVQNFNLANDGKVAVTGKGMTRVYLVQDIKRNEKIRSIHIPGSDLIQSSRVEFSHTGDVLAVLSKGIGQDRIQLWRPGSTYCCGIWSDTNRISDIQFSPNGKWVVGAYRAKINFWNIDTMTVHRTFSLPDMTIRKFGLSPDGNFLFVLRQGEISRYGPRFEEKIQSCEPIDYVGYVARNLKDISVGEKEIAISIEPEITLDSGKYDDQSAHQRSILRLDHDFNVVSTFDGFRNGKFSQDGTVIIGIKDSDCNSIGLQYPTGQLREVFTGVYKPVSVILSASDKSGRRTLLFVSSDLNSCQHIHRHELDELAVPHFPSLAAASPDPETLPSQSDHSDEIRADTPVTPEKIDISTPNSCEDSIEEVPPAALGSKRVSCCAIL